MSAGGQLLGTGWLGEMPPDAVALSLGIKAGGAGDACEEGGGVVSGALESGESRSTRGDVLSSFYKGEKNANPCSDSMSVYLM